MWEVIRRETRESEAVKMREVGEVIKNKALGSDRNRRVGNSGKESVHWGRERRGKQRLKCGEGK